MKRRDKKIDLDNALLDCMKAEISKGKAPSLEEALEDELGKDEKENESRGNGWV